MGERSYPPRRLLGGRAGREDSWTKENEAGRRRTKQKNRNGVERHRRRGIHFLRGMKIGLYLARSIPGVGQASLELWRAREEKEGMKISYGGGLLL